MDCRDGAFLLSLLAVTETTALHRSGDRISCLRLPLNNRRHLNGLAMVSGKPRYVTALGETDEVGGWRHNKRGGGVLMDVEPNQVLLRGLSMPHSPRLWAGRLWLLESGQGTLAYADLPNQTWHTVTSLPGFTRGIDFAVPLAFIWLSQVRETAVFSDIPLLDRLEERTCGVWVVNVQTGETVAFLRFRRGRGRPLRRAGRALSFSGNAGIRR